MGPRHLQLFDRFGAVLRHGGAPIGLLGFLAASGLAEEVPADQPGTAATDISVAYKKLSLEELMDIEVTSVSRRPERLAETASAIQVITQEDIRRSGVSSIPEALRLASNLEVAQIDSRQWAISARGFNSTTSNKMLVMIDGRTVYTPLYAGVFWDAQDVLLADLERIEVISGPGATLWGANAVNGVINLTSKDARDTQGFHLEGGGGNELRGFAGLRYGGELAPTLHYRVYGKYFDRDDTVLPNGDDATDQWRMGQGGYRADWQASDDDLFTLQGDVSHGVIDQAGPDDLKIYGANTLGRWSHRISADSDLKLQLYYDRTYRAIPASITEDLDTYDADFQHRFRIGARNDVVWGLGYRVIQDDISNPSTLAFLPAEVTRDWLSAFAQDEIALVESRLNLTLGSKVEHNDYTGFEVQPSARLAWRATEQQTVWGAVSRAVRTPSRIDTEFYAPGDPPFTFLQGGSDFVSEKVIAYELGYRLQPDESLSLALSTYYNDYRDIRSVEQVNPPAPFPIEIANGLEGESYGAELTGDYRVLESWRLRAGYTELRIHLRPKAGSTDTSGGSGESHDPEHMASLRSMHDLPGHCEVDATFRYVSRIENQDVPGYGELDLRFGWLPRPNLELSLVGQNLLHDHHPEFGAATSRREIERSAYAKVAWDF